MRRSLLVAGVMALCLVFLASGVVSAKAKWTKQLGMKCAECHDGKPAEKKFLPGAGQVAVGMVKMMAEVNGQLKAPLAQMDCYGCHRGAAKIAKADDKVEGATTPEIDKAMKDLTAAADKACKVSVPAATVSCATCHHGKGKVPEKP